MKFTFGGGKSAKTQPIKTKRPAVLLDDGNSSSDGEGAAAASARPKPTAMSFAQQTNEAAVIGQAIQEDPSIFDYDASHDTTQARRNVLADRKRGAIDPGTGKLQANTRKLKRQREEEALEDNAVEEYAEKEQFITDAYRQRQKELEELDKQQESALEETAEGGPVTDMAVFYRQVLENATALPALPPDNSDSLKHAPSMSALLKSDGQEEKARLEKDIASGRVAVNDANEVIDKRQLLQGGLNIKPAKRIALEQEKNAAEAARKRAEQDAEREREEARKRQEMKARYAKARMEQEKQKKELEAAAVQKAAREQEEITRKLTEKASTSAIEEARARYLARKMLQKKTSSDSDSE
ncbi:MAG: hypothetical protein SGCHY_001815 [Lobulomycetales sp.]